MPNSWTIVNDPPPNPGVGNALNGLQIQQVTSGTPPVVTGYQLMNGSTLLASTTDTTMPICFNNVSLARGTWDICANVSPGVNGSGTWETGGVHGEFSAGFEETGDAGSSAYA